MSMHEQWACPDDSPKRPDGSFNPIPGSEALFDDCPAYYLRGPGDRPAEHLIDGHTHPARMVSEWAFEIEAGSRNVESLSPKAVELVHLHIREKGSRDRFQREKEREARGR